MFNFYDFKKYADQNKKKFMILILKVNWDIH